MQVLLVTCGGWHLPHTARALAERGALAGLWLTDRNRVGVPAAKVRRCWPFQIAMQPWYRLVGATGVQRAFHTHFPLWKLWLQTQPYPPCDAIVSIMSFASEPFEYAERVGALKVLDCPNSHPTTLYGYWQRECDLWCPGERVPIPRFLLARANREVERADVIMCPSTFVRETMIDNGVPAEKCFVNPFGVDVTMFAKRESLPDIPRFISVGTICLRKGHQYLLRAFEQVKKELPRAELICVGNYLNDFRMERRRWEGTFTHIPSLSHAELGALLRSCTAFVFPSQEEGLARVIVEAMASGLPILASRESGAPTLIENGREGMLIPGRDSRRLADAMIEVATNPDLNRALGDAAWQRGTQRNTWQDYGDRLLAECAIRMTGRLMRGGS